MKEEQQVNKNMQKPIGDLNACKCNHDKLSAATAEWLKKFKIKDSEIDLTRPKKRKKI